MPSRVLNLCFMLHSSHIIPPSRLSNGDIKLWEVTDSWRRSWGILHRLRWAKAYEPSWKGQDRKNHYSIIYHKVIYTEICIQLRCQTQFIWSTGYVLVRQRLPLSRFHLFYLLSSFFFPFMAFFLFLLCLWYIMRVTIALVLSFQTERKREKIF